MAMADAIFGQVVETFMPCNLTQSMVKCFDNLAASMIDRSTTLIAVRLHR